MNTQATTRHTHTHTHSDSHIPDLSGSSAYKLIFRVESFLYAQHKLLTKPFKLVWIQETVAIDIEQPELVEHRRRNVVNGSRAVTEVRLPFCDDPWSQVKD